MDKTIVKGMAVLEALVASPEPVGVSELARQVGLTKSNIHRTLQTFVELGYVASLNGRYSATLKIWQQGAKVIERLDLRHTIRPIMDQLARATLETVHLAISAGPEVIYIEKSEGVHSVRAFSEIGERAPAHCSATGKVFLAFHPTALRETLSQPLRAYTPRTITDPEQLEAAVADVRELGFAINRGEWEAAVGGVSAPVWGPDNQLIASMGLTLPLSRFTDENQATLITQVRAAAAEASRALGASPGIAGARLVA
ncbi:IclR family transcriptional regulator [Sphingomonas sp. HITSZ_GF]|uniref:IclR family transcriptional regulator n=1 Tax=Sphingomonas sp. HITSZ_GF TaxID=3037247 RepID=UPI00240D01B1|nr:IclR family transcriptional regulator [Sphingomonas sp. HITSZ_GF]MDG2532153.1 IclR family transcriptional regulator [Sphingomonas sp. HITSZ_GF]